jgi:hypothetical protein
VSRQAKLQNRVTNDLSDALDELQEWLQSKQADLELEHEVNRLSNALAELPECAESSQAD